VRLPKSKKKTERTNNLSPLKKKLKLESLQIGCKATKKNWDK
jgi:hypothetical protein